MSSRTEIKLFDVTFTEDPNEVEYHDFKIICKTTGRILYVHRLILAQILYFKSMMKFNKTEYITDNYDVISLIVKHVYHNNTYDNYLRSLDKTNCTFDQLLTIYNTFGEILTPNFKIEQKYNPGYNSTLFCDIYNHLPINLIIDNFERAHEVFIFPMPRKHFRKLQYEIILYVEKNIFNYDTLLKNPLFELKNRKGQYLFVHAKMMLLIKKAKKDFSLKEMMDLYQNGKHLYHDKFMHKNDNKEYKPVSDERYLFKRDLFILYLIENELELIDASEQKILLEKCYEERHLMKCYDNFFNRFHELTKIHHIPYVKDKDKSNDGFCITDEFGIKWVNANGYFYNSLINNMTDQICKFKVEWRSLSYDNNLKIKYEVRKLFVYRVDEPDKSEYNKLKVEYIDVLGFYDRDIKQNCILINSKPISEYNSVSFIKIRNYINGVKINDKKYYARDFDDWKNEIVLQYVLNIQ